MNRDRRRKKRVLRQKQKSDLMNRSPNTETSNQMTKEEIQELIVDALQEYDKKRIETEQNNEYIKQKEYDSIIGINDYPELKGLHRYFAIGKNRLKTLLRLIIFTPKEVLENDNVVYNLMKMGVIILLRAIYWFLFAASLFGILSYPLSFFLTQLPRPHPIVYVLLFYFGLLVLMFAQLFRIASIQVNKMRNRDRIVDLFAGAIGLIALVISIIIR